jgi:uncharacterized protein YwqG
VDPGAIIAMAVGLVIAVIINGGPRLLDFLRRRTNAPQLRREAEQRRREAEEFMRNAAGGRPPMSSADAEELKRWFDENTLPFTACTIGGRPAASDQASHAGGRPWLPAGVDWPKDLRGDPMAFLLQLNFSEIPPLPEFPDRGLLLFFIAADDRFGAYADGDRDDICVIFVPDLAVAGVAVSTPLRMGQTPFYDPSAEAQGRSISFAPIAQMRPWGSDWRIDDKWPGWWARGGDESFAELVDDGDRVPPESYIGGNLLMIHGDPRSENGWRDLDRVLMRIGSGDAIQWGDVGVACFLIRRSDLAARNFTRVRFSWDSN